GRAAISKSAGTNDTISASLVLQSDLVITNTSTSRLLISGAISGARGLTKLGSGGLVLQGLNTYTGSTVIGGGTVSLEASGSIADSANIDVLAGAIFDSTAAGGLALSSNQKLSGAGAILGNVTA